MTVRAAEKARRLRVLVASGRRLPVIRWRLDSPDLHVRITVRGHRERVRRQAEGR
jgi:hypothetical protein